ncbi:MAG: fused response regulator/phosphatase [Bacteroidales bacterium]|nr:fused response regulator/phosphatase [Bacteroidales bacterium]
MGSNSHYTILVADDSEADLMYAKQVLSSYHFEHQIIIAHDGMELCQLAIEQRPDLILAELEMPGMDGLDAIQFLKQNQLTRDIPIIVLTVDENFEQVLEAGAIDLIRKPFEEIQLILRVRAALKLAEAYRAIDREKLEVEKRNHQLKKQHESTLRQKNIITEKNQAMYANLKYAKRIQDAFLPDPKDIEQAISRYFVLNLPKNVVSGDFYWIDRQNNHLLIAVADGTGHGLSGALMHMMGIIFLNQIIKQRRYTNPAEILCELREYMISSLQQKGEIGEAQGGMDMALCMLDLDQRKVQFAGANNPIYIINNQGLKEIKGDRMPVGININYDKPFTNQQIQLQSGDTLYMFTDGYADQFGGDKGKKFRYKYFKELLISNHGIPMTKQKEVLHNTFFRWKGDYEQIDDVMVMGIRVP